MQVIITGGAGFLGRRLARRLLDRGAVRGETFDELLLVDRGAQEWGDPRVRTVAGDVAEPVTMRTLVGPQTGFIFHLAAIVSGEAEADPEAGMRVNVDASRLLLDLCRAAHVPTVVFTSSVAVYGADLPPLVTDATMLRPRSSYGTQKAIAELLLCDSTRRGLINGRVLRLPTIAVRPGMANRAASSFVSALIREPLDGEETVCPVSPDLRLWLLSPDAAVESLIRTAELPQAALGGNPLINAPGVSVAVAEMIAALGRAVGREAVARIRYARDPAIEAIVDSWPAAWDVGRAEALGLRGDVDFDAILRAYIDEMAPGSDHSDHSAQPNR